MSGFPLTDYPSYAAEAVASYVGQAKAFSPTPYVPNFSVAWDPSTRTVQSDVFDAAAVATGYPFSPALQPTGAYAYCDMGPALARCRPSTCPPVSLVAEIQTALVAAAATIAAECDPAWCLLTVYAYTEFSEGGTLWPTQEDGFGRLQAFQAVFGNRSQSALAA